MHDTEYSSELFSYPKKNGIYVSVLEFKVVDTVTNCILLKSCTKVTMYSTVWSKYFKSIDSIGNCKLTFMFEGG